MLTTGIGRFNIDEARRMAASFPLFVRTCVHVFCIIAYVYQSVLTSSYRYIGRKL